MLAVKRDPVAAGHLPLIQSSRQQPDGQIRAWAGVAQVVEPQLVEPRGDAVQLLEPRLSRPRSGRARRGAGSARSPATAARRRPRARAPGGPAGPSRAWGRARCPVGLLLATTIIDSLTRGSRSMPSSSGSMSSNRCGSNGPWKQIRAAPTSPSASMRSPIQCGTKSSVSRGGVLEPRVLDVRIEVPDVDELGAARVGRLGDARLIGSCPGSALIADDLTRLHVGADPTASSAIASTRPPAHLIRRPPAEADTRGKIFESVSPASATASRSYAVRHREAVALEPGVLERCTRSPTVSGSPAISESIVSCGTPRSSSTAFLASRLPRASARSATRPSAVLVISA